MRHWRWYSKLLFALLVAAFAYWVWPTPWRYDHVREIPIRTHRVTDRAQMFRGDWESLPPPRRLPETALESYEHLKEMSIRQRQLYFECGGELPEGYGSWSEFFVRH